METRFNRCLVGDSPVSFWLPTSFDQNVFLSTRYHMAAYADWLSCNLTDLKVGCLVRYDLSWYWKRLSSGFTFGQL